MKIFVARILYPVKVLGPGNRIGIWLAGCSRRCEGCSNPELWTRKDEWKMDTRELLQIINGISVVRRVDGFTITGGDPFEQAEALGELLPALKPIADDILVYTGFQYAEIKARFADVLRDVSVLIDGPYLRAHNHGQRLRGSDNQSILYLDPRIRQKYEDYLTGMHADIQNFSVGDGVISVGIHLPDFNDELDKKAQKKGLIKHE